MSTSITALPYQLGAYTLTRLIETRAGSDVFAASQGSVGREVALEVLRSGASPEQQATFLATARKRVEAARLPHVGQVYESLCAEGLWFLTQELPLGRSLADYVAAEESLYIADVCHILIAAAELYESCDKAKHASLPLSEASVFLTPEGKPRFLSPIITGEASDNNALKLTALGMLLRPLVPQGVPGTSRVETLLYWMRHGFEGQALTWLQVRATAQTILNQLGITEEVTEQATEEGIQRRRRRQQRRMIFMAAYGAGLFAMAALISCLGFIFRSPEYIAVPAVHEHGVTCRMPNGSRMLLQPAPVSVAEYADFLHRWEATEPTAREPYLHGLPEEYHTLTPAEWDKQQAANPHTPVTGVTYMQALVYARFHNAELPSLTQLQTAFERAGSGSVQEWTKDLFAGDGNGVLDKDSPLAVSAEEPFIPIPLPGHDYHSPSLGFRLIQPHTSNE